jgi:hypothetical protein
MKCEMLSGWRRLAATAERAGDYRAVLFYYAENRRGTRGFSA